MQYDHGLLRPSYACSNFSDVSKTRRIASNFIKSRFNLLPELNRAQRAYAIFEIFNFVIGGSIDEHCATSPKFRMETRKKWAEKSLREGLLEYDPQLVERIDLGLEVLWRRLPLRKDYVRVAPFQAKVEEQKVFSGPGWRVNNMCSANGTSLMSGVLANYCDLVKMFGPPIGPSRNGKTMAEWHIEFEDGEVATLYDYKSYMPKEGNIDWHIGAKNYKTAERLAFILRKLERP